MENRFKLIFTTISPNSTLDGYQLIKCLSIMNESSCPKNTKLGRRYFRLSIKIVFLAYISIDFDLFCSLRSEWKAIRSRESLNDIAGAINIFESPSRQSTLCAKLSEVEINKYTQSASSGFLNGSVYFSHNIKTSRIKFGLEHLWIKSIGSDLKNVCC